MDEMNESNWMVNSSREQKIIGHGYVRKEYSIVDVLINQILSHYLQIKTITYKLMMCSDFRGFNFLVL